MVNTIHRDIIAPSTALSPAVSNLTEAMNTLINFGVINTRDLIQTEVNVIVQAVKDVLNEVFRTGNAIMNRLNNVLTNIYKRIVDRLTRSLDRTTQVIERSSRFFGQVLEGVHNIFKNLAARLLPQFQTCSAKLTSLSMKAVATTLETYTKDVTALINGVNADLQGKVTSISSHVNTTDTRITLVSAQLTADLLKNISIAFDAEANKTPAFTQCLDESTATVEYLQDLIDDNVDLCSKAATDAANAAQLALVEQTSDLQESAIQNVTTTCNCANVPTGATMAQKLTAQTCASRESKNLDITVLQAEVSAIRASFDSDAIIAQFDACIAEIENEIDPIREIVNSDIETC